MPSCYSFTLNISFIGYTVETIAFAVTCELHNDSDNYSFIHLSVELYLCMAPLLSVLGQ